MDNETKQSYKQSYTDNVELSIFNCGHEYCQPGHTWGPGVRDHYLIHLVVAGRGVYQVNGSSYTLQEGDLFLAKPNQLITYAADEVEYWGIAGLLHDLGEEQCDWEHDLSVHGPTSVEILKKEGIDDPVLFGAICAHNPKSGVKAKTKIQYALLAADPMSGFLKAVAQIYPDKKIASVKRKSVIKRFNEARFAKGANRDYMESIEFTGLMLEDLIDIGLEEMCAISDELGL